MAKLFNRHVGLPLGILMAGELASIASALVAAAYLRFGHEAAAVLLQPAGGSNLLLLATVCILCLYYADLYEGRILRDRREAFVRLLRALGATSMVVAAVYYWFPELILGRGVFAV